MITVDQVRLIVSTTQHVWLFVETFGLEKLSVGLDSVKRFGEQSFMEVR
jgi:hypothetical protein